MKLSGVVMAVVWLGAYTGCDEGAATADATGVTDAGATDATDAGVTAATDTGPTSVTDPPLEDTSVTTTPPLEDTTMTTAPPLEDTAAMTTPPLEDTTVTTTPPLEDTTATTTPPLEDTAVTTAPPLEDTTMTTAPPLEDDVEVVSPCDVPGDAGCDDAVDPLAALSDDFEDPASLADWHLLTDVLGVPAQHDRIDVDTTVPGALVIEPNAYRAPFLPADGGPGWFEDSKGPLLYKELSGDFVIVAHVRVATVASLATAPDGLYNAGGFVVRDARSDDPDDPTRVGDERWVMHNIGFQADTFASETKTTFPDGARPGPWSDSSLFLTPLPGNAGRLALCRIGSHFYFFHDMDAAPGWQAETHTAANLVVNDAFLPAADLESGFDRPDIADPVQVGFIANRWRDGSVAPRVVVSWVTFATPASLADCTPP